MLTEPASLSKNYNIIRREKLKRSDTTQSPNTFLRDEKLLRHLIIHRFTANNRRKKNDTPMPLRTLAHPRSLFLLTILTVIIIISQDS